MQIIQSEQGQQEVYPLYYCQDMPCHAPFFHAFGLVSLPFSLLPDQDGGGHGRGKKGGSIGVWPSA